MSIKDYKTEQQKTHLINFRISESEKMKLDYMSYTEKVSNSEFLRMLLRYYYDTNYNK